MNKEHFKKTIEVINTIPLDKWENGVYSRDKFGNHNRRIEYPVVFVDSVALSECGKLLVVFAQTIRENNERFRTISKIATRS